MPHNVTGYETVPRKEQPCKKRTPGRIRVDIRGANPVGCFLLLRWALGLKTTHWIAGILLDAPHGIGGNPARSITGVVIVGNAMSTDIAKGGGICIAESPLISCSIYLPNR
jgi:hypothetical protein